MSKGGKKKRSTAGLILDYLIRWEYTAYILYLGFGDISPRAYECACGFFSIMVYFVETHCVNSGFKEIYVCNLVKRNKIGHPTALCLVTTRGKGFIIGIGLCKIVPHFKVKDFHLGGFAEWKADMIVFSYLVDEQSIGEILHSLWRELPLDGQIWIILFDRTRIPIIQIGFNIIWIQSQQRIVYRFGIFIGDLLSRHWYTINDEERLGSSCDGVDTSDSESHSA